MNIFSKILSLLSPRERRQGLYVLLMVTLMAALELAGIASVMPFLSVLGNPEMIEENAYLSAVYSGLGFKSSDGFLIALGSGAFILVLASALFKAVTHYAMNRFIEMRRHSISERLLETYLRQPYSYFLHRHSSDMAKSILSEVDQAVANGIRPAVQMMAYGIVLISLLILLVVVNPWLALSVFVVFGGLYGIIYSSLRRKLNHIGHDRANANKERFTAAGEALGGIKDIKLLGREHAYLRRFSGPSARFSKHQATNQTIGQIPNFLVEAVAFGGIIIVTLVLLASLGGVAEGGLGGLLPVLGLYAFAGLRLKPAAQHVFQGLSQLRFGTAAIDQLYDDIRNRTHSVELHAQAPAPLRPRSALSLKRLHYRYPKADTDVLTNINLKIPVGSSLGIVGSTGAGKTTLVDVLLGLLRPSSGTLNIDETEVTEANLRSYQQSVGYVPQDIFLTDSSVAANIALGIPVEQIDHERVARCARMAQVHDFIMQELPEQYATLVGERGVRISGGQRQRIGIARALYHNPSILVFDEATSALDSATEHAVMEAIGTLHHQKTVILIAHRLSTVRDCDQVILLDKGEVVASGTYEELTRNSDRFRQLASGDAKS